TWYKKALKESLLGKIYADKAKVKGIDQDPRANAVIYQEYLKAFRKGVFSYIKEDINQYTHERIPKKYFSGGFMRQDHAMRIIRDLAQVTPGERTLLKRKLDKVVVDAVPANLAMTAFLIGLVAIVWIVKYFIQRDLAEMEFTRYVMDKVDVGKVSWQDVLFSTVKQLRQPNSIDLEQAQGVRLTEAETVFFTQFITRIKKISYRQYLDMTKSQNRKPFLTKEEAKTFCILAYRLRPAIIGKVVSEAWFINFLAVMALLFLNDNPSLKVSSQHDLEDLVIKYFAQNNVHSFPTEERKSLAREMKACFRQGDKDSDGRYKIIFRERNVAVESEGTPWGNATRLPQQERIISRAMKSLRLIRGIIRSARQVEPSTIDRGVWRLTLFYYGPSNDGVWNNERIAETAGFLKKHGVQFRNEGNAFVIVLGKFKSQEQAQQEAERVKTQLLTSKADFETGFRRFLADVLPFTGILEDFEIGYRRLLDQTITTQGQFQRGVKGISLTHRRDGQDNAMNYGGIDLNSANMAMVIKRDGKGIPLPVAQQDMAQLSAIKGFEPHILEVQSGVALSMQEPKHI
ncbi:MAG: hypothetical protein HQL13_06990, partial [Candidatus Omnitrophica bacterium]|nr:hypothetical protein [Candidatus Omnitrophota bacterium]